MYWMIEVSLGECWCTVAHSSTHLEAPVKQLPVGLLELCVGDILEGMHCNLGGEVL
jgi:hypothetical protein